MRRVLVATIFCLYGGTALAQLPASEELGNRVDAVAKQMLSRITAGVSVAVARDGRVILARGYGMANVEHSVAVTPETVFHIASISKNILAAVVLQLVDEGKLRLDDDVTKYVPEAPTLGHHVTVRQLLNHTSGIYSFTSLPDAANNERFELTHEQVLGLIKDKPFEFEPGTRWRYDNSAFYIAGMVVERVTKQEYGAYVREHVFKPLGMSSASLCDARMVVPHLASGYELNLGDAGARSPIAMAADIARAVLGLKKNVPLDLPVPNAELTALSGKYDSDEGPVEIFARDGKLHFRIPGTQIEGVIRRQAENVYAVDENTEAHFLVSGGRAEWSMVYIGGLLLDAKYRVN